MAAEQPKAVRSGDGRAPRVLDDTFARKITAADTGDSHSVTVMASFPDGGRPPDTNG